VEPPNGDQKKRSMMDRFVDVQLEKDEINKVLSVRASMLAQVPNKGEEASSINQYVTVRLGNEHFGLDVRFVREIQPLKDLTLIPCTPDFIVGAVNIRGNILPLLDIKQFFGMPRSNIMDSSKVIVIHDGDLQIGILGDSVEEVVRLATDDIDPQLATLSGIQEEFIRGVSDSHIIILDIEALITDRRIVIQEDI